MKKGDVTCPKCGAGFRRIKLSSQRGTKGEYHCPICSTVLEVFDGACEVVYRLTVVPNKHLELWGRALSKVKSRASAYQNGPAAAGPFLLEETKRRFPELPKPA